MSKSIQKHTKTERIGSAGGIGPVPKSKSEFTVFSSANFQQKKQQFFAAKTNMAGWKIHLLKMYFLLKMGISIAMLVFRSVPPQKKKHTHTFSQQNLWAYAML